MTSGGTQGRSALGATTGLPVTRGLEESAMDHGRLTVLILGGYGTFGGRLAELLAGEPRLSLVIAGRSLERAERFIAALAPGAERTGLRLDRNDGELASIFAQ